MILTQTKLSERHWTIVLLLYLCFVYTPFILSKGPTTLDFLPGDCKYYRAVIVSLLKDGDLLLANNVEDPLNGQLALGNDGLVPKHPIIMSLVSIPFYLAFGNYGLLLFNIINCMIVMVLIFKLNCLFFIRSTALITTALFATGTLFLNYTYNYSPDVFSTVLLLAGLYLVLKERFYWGAFFLGLSIFAKIPNLPLAGLILFYAGFVILKGATTNGDTGQTFMPNKLTVLAATIAVFIVALIPLAYANYRLFGSPVVTGYQRTAIAGGAGQLVLMDHTSSFNQPFLKGVYRMLLDRHNGLIPTGPIILLAVPGLFIVLLRRGGDRKKIYLILTICLIQFAFFSKYDYLDATASGNRFLMTFVALSSVFVSNFFSWSGRRLYQPHPAQSSISAADGTTSGKSTTL